MSLNYSSDSESDCEEEYLEYCSENKTELNFIVQQTKILCRLRRLEAVNDNLLWQIEKVVEALFEVNENLNKSVK
jgi:hypothetical protein